jgi:hypothetical protein
MGLLNFLFGKRTKKEPQKSMYVDLNELIIRLEDELDAENLTEEVVEDEPVIEEVTKPVTDIFTEEAEITEPVEDTAIRIAESEQDKVDYFQKPEDEKPSEETESDINNTPQSSDTAAIDTEEPSIEPEQIKSENSESYSKSKGGEFLTPEDEEMLNTTKVDTFFTALD